MKRKSATRHGSLLPEQRIAKELTYLIWWNSLVAIAGRKHAARSAKRIKNAV